MLLRNIVPLVAALIAVGTPAAAEPQPAAKEILAVGFQKQYAARAETDALYQRIASAGNADRNVTYAYALALLSQGRYPQAEAPLKQTIAFDPEAAAPRRTYIRNLMLLKKYSTAVIEAGELSDRLAKLPVDQRPDDDAFRSATLLGRLVAYLQGPVPQPALADDLRRLIASADLWPLELKQEFEQAQLESARLQGDIQREIDKFAEKTEKELQEQKDFLAESIEGRSDELQEKQGVINEAAAKAQEDARAELAALAAREAPLAASYAELERRAILIRRELAPIVFDINQLLAQADETEDPAEREFLLRRVDRLERIAVRYEADLAALGREAARLESQLIALRREQAIVQARFASDQSRLADAQQGIERGEKILESDRRKLQRGLSAPTGGLRSLTRQLTAYTTYDDFDLAAQREKMLKSLE